MCIKSTILSTGPSQHPIINHVFVILRSITTANNPREAERSIFLYKYIASIVICISMRSNRFCRIFVDFTCSCFSRQV